MWMSDPFSGVSQSMLVGLGVWVAFGYLWTFAPRFGVARDYAVASFGVGGVGGVLGARVMWWFSQGLERGDGFFSRELLQEVINPMRAGYSSLGFLAGAGLVIWMLDRRSGAGAEAGAETRGRLLDVVVLAGLLGMVFARFGCVFNGCDFGRVSGVGVFSVRYARGSLAWQRHVSEGLIGGEQLWSLPTHGFALYSAGATLGIVAMVSLWSWRREADRRSGGEAAKWAIAAFCIAQFALEFLREPANGGTLAQQLNINQIALMGVFMFLGVRHIVDIAQK